MNKVFLFALQLGVLAPFWRSMQALLWANSGRASEGALWNIVYCGGPLLIACALARWRILKGKETFSLIQAACGVRPRIKWTNDIILNGRKLVGILTELGLVSESNSLDYLVTGIGINVNHRPEDFSPDIRDMAISLSQALGHPVRRSHLAAQVILALDRMYADFPRNKAEYLEKYRSDCLTPGNQVQLITPVSRQEAYALAIDDDFRLVVELPDGTRRALSAGEVSERGMYGYV